MFDVAQDRPIQRSPIGASLTARDDFEFGLVHSGSGDDMDNRMMVQQYGRGSRFGNNFGHELKGGQIVDEIPGNVSPHPNP
jgi:hypothetical protein